LVAFAVLIAPAAAQEPTPTPTPTPTPAPELSDAERDVYRDYRRDGVIEACDHKKKTLKQVLEELPPEADLDTPDLRPALEAGIEQHRDGDCDEPEPTPTPTPTATPAPTAAPAPTTAPAPDDPVDSGAVDPLPGGGGGGGGGTPTPPGAEDVAPLDPSVTPVPPASIPAPAAPAPAEPSGPAATPEPAYANADDELPLSLLVLAGLLALVALLALLFALATRFGWGERWLARPRRALSEAGFRAGGTWGDFADWIRFGR